MSREIGESEADERPTLPIEKGFPIERVNEIAAKEGRAKQWYRPIYTMHKWWARRLGCVFRAVSLYTLIDNPDDVDITEPGENGNLSDFTSSNEDIGDLIDQVNLEDPEALWKLYSKDVRVADKRVLDPFAGGGTSLVETSRFGAKSTGYDLNPVAWFVTKKELDAHKTEVDDLKEAFERVKQEVSESILEYYRTSCPNGDHEADVMYAFWVKEIDCVSCGHTVPLFNDYRVGKGRYENDDKYHVFCPKCESVVLVDDWQSECKCEECRYRFVPKNGNAPGSKYTCGECGQKYGIIDAVQEQGGFNLRLFALEYYCPTCEDRGEAKKDIKNYKPAEEEDVALFEKAKREFEIRDDLEKYVPKEEIPLGIKTDSTKFEGSITGGHNVLRHGFDKWTDMYNGRQLLCLSLLLQSIDGIEDQNVKEYLLLGVSEMLRFNTMMVGYQASNNHINDIFQSNSFDPPKSPAENNLWGTKYGMGTFESVWEMIIRGVEYAHAPTERYVDDGETVESKEFATPIGEESSIHCNDMRTIDQSMEFDAVITDPPYYDNVIYSELSDYFYVWQRVLLKDEYECFNSAKTPRDESIVANPAVQKGSTEFEDELRQSFDTIAGSLAEDGVLAFTYHHSDVESWGELLSALCDVGFEVTATYPISADTYKFFEGEAVEFDIIIIARPANDRQPISWNSLRRSIYRTAKKTRKRLEENRDLSRGDIGVVEMGRCFHEYSKHHGKVERAGETMTAKEVVDEIYGVIQQGSNIGEIEVFLDLLETPNASYDDLNKLTRGTDATPEQMNDMRLYRMADGFTLGTWDDEKRIAYIQSRVDSGDELTDLDRAQFLRWRWEQGKSVTEYLEQWEITDDLRELCEGLADATGDDTYRNILESRLSDY
ncbi:hypothetical protein GCM10028857_18690 [Salinarchaeum chitinilyticum]